MGGEEHLDRTENRGTAEESEHPDQLEMWDLVGTPVALKQDAVAMTAIRDMVAPREQPGDQEAMDWWEPQERTVTMEHQEPRERQENQHTEDQELMEGQEGREDREHVVLEEALVMPEHLDEISTVTGTASSKGICLVLLDRQEILVTQGVLEHQG